MQNVISHQLLGTQDNMTRGAPTKVGMIERVKAEKRGVLHCLWNLLLIWIKDKA
jgi:hypothetical protein